MKSKVKNIAITIGDPCGIGPEVTAKALARFLSKRNIRFTIIGDEFIFRRYQKKSASNITFVDCKSLLPNQWRSGKGSSKSAQASLLYLNTALKLIKTKEACALVTAPVSKEAICALGVHFQGHTEYIANYFKIKKFGMMFVADKLKTVVATRHIPLSSVSKKITPSLLAEIITLTAQSLENYFNIRNPKIAICGINPHAGEKGKMGTEEIKTIIPAITKIKKNGVRIHGPFSADTLFYPLITKKYDVIIAMYHDQGLIAIKSLYFKNLVNLTIGLPFVRTSPAHGTAFDIAGKNKADPSSMRAAIELALQLSQ